MMFFRQPLETDLSVFIQTEVNVKPVTEIAASVVI